MCNFFFIFLFSDLLTAGFGSIWTFLGSRIRMKTYADPKPCLKVVFTLRLFPLLKQYHSDRTAAFIIYLNLSLCVHVFRGLAFCKTVPQESWARDNTVAITRPCFPATKLVFTFFAILLYLMWLLYKHRDINNILKFFWTLRLYYVVAVSLSQSHKIVCARLCMQHFT